MSIYKTIPLVVLAVCLTGCDGISLKGHISTGSGSGPVIVASKTMKTEKRTVGSFDKIEASGVVIVDVTNGATAPIEVSGADNILPHLKTEVEDGTLKIHLDGNFEDVRELHVTISAPKIIGADASGASKINIKGMPAGPLTAKVDGASYLTFDGAPSELDMEVSGAAHLLVTGLNAKKVSGEADGASTVELKGKTDSVDLEFSGAAHLIGTSLQIQSGTIDANGAASVELADKSKVTATVSGAANVR